MFKYNEARTYNSFDRIQGTQTHVLATALAATCQYTDWVRWPRCRHWLRSGRRPHGLARARRAVSEATWAHDDHLDARLDGRGGHAERIDESESLQLGSVMGSVMSGIAAR